MVGVATINGKEYRLHYGMVLAEKFLSIVIGEDDKPKNPSTPQILKCIIYHGHENWCEIHDEPFSLKKSEVAVFVEESYADKNEDSLREFETITKEFMKSRFVDDLIKKGNEADKKKVASSATSSEPPSES